MITEETVSHVARLARLELSSEEISRYTQELGKILHLVDELSELDLSGSELETTAEQPTLFRADEAQKLFSREELLANAPQEEDGFFRVPKILDEGE
jgi:aspartyl-tRNA(Asn)/glutamyl-tRNA(Gln) amidotransferase subunit C